MNETQKTKMITVFQRLNEQGVFAKAPIDLDKVASVLNAGIVMDHTLNDGPLIASIKMENGRPIVRVSPVKTSYLARRRVVIAHMLGHAFLHLSALHPEFNDTDKSIESESLTNDRLEVEASRFAEHLLMPTLRVVSEGSRVIDELPQINGVSESEIVLKMAGIFEVPIKVMEKRLKALGMMQVPEKRSEIDPIPGFA